MLFDHLATNDCEVTWALCDCPPLPANEGVARLAAWNWIEETYGVPLPIPKPESWPRLWALVRSADVVLVHDVLYLTSIIAAFAARWHGKPLVILVHIWRVNYARAIWNLLQTLAAWMAKHLVANKAVAIIVYNRRIGSEVELAWRRKPLFIPNGIDATFCADNESVGEIRDAARTEVVFAGRFVEKKGLDIVREAAEQLPEIEFNLCGSGPVDPGAWLCRNVRLHGRLQPGELRDLFHRNSLLLLPSRGEGFPLVIQEAMACGLRCAVFEETWSAWGEGREYFLILDPKNYIHQIREFLSRPESEETARQIREYALSHWSRDNMMTRYRALLQLCASGERM